VFLPNYLIVQEGKRKRELRPAGFLFTPGIMEWVFSSGISVSNLKTKSKIRMDPRVKPEDDEKKNEKKNTSFRTRSGIHASPLANIYGFSPRRDQIRG
jgi:hypothetical protein